MCSVRCSSEAVSCDGHRRVGREGVVRRAMLRARRLRAASDLGGIWETAIRDIQCRTTETPKHKKPEDIRSHTLRQSASCPTSARCSRCAAWCAQPARLRHRQDPLLRRRDEIGGSRLNVLQWLRTQAWRWNSNNQLLLVSFKCRRATGVHGRCSRPLLGCGILSQAAPPQRQATTLRVHPNPA